MVSNEYLKWAKDVRGRRLTNSSTIKELNDRHHAIIRMHVLGYSQTEISNALRISQTTVCHVLQNSAVREKIDDLRTQLDNGTEDMAKAIQGLAPSALRVMQDALEGVNRVTLDGTETVTVIKPKERLTAARDILDRSGHGAVSRSEVATMHLTPDELQEIRERANAARPRIVEVTDVDAENEE